MRSAPHLDLVLDLVKHLVHLRVRDLVHGAHVHARAARVLGGLRQGQGGFNQPEKESIPTTTTCYVYPALKAYPVPYRARRIPGIPGSAAKRQRSLLQVLFHVSRAGEAELRCELRVKMVYET